VAACTRSRSTCAASAFGFKGTGLAARLRIFSRVAAGPKTGPPVITTPPLTSACSTRGPRPRASRSPTTRGLRQALLSHTMPCDDWQRSATCACSYSFLWATLGGWWGARSSCFMGDSSAIPTSGPRPRPSTGAARHRNRSSLGPSTSLMNLKNRVLRASVALSRCTSSRPVPSGSTAATGRERGSRYLPLPPVAERSPSCCACTSPCRPGYRSGPPPLLPRIPNPTRPLRAADVGNSAACSSKPPPPWHASPALGWC